MVWYFCPLALVMFFAGPPKIFAYPTPVDFNGKLMRWNVSKNAPYVRYEILYGAADMDTATSDVIDEAAGMWSDIDGSLLKLVAPPQSEKAQITIHVESEFEGSSYSAGYATFDKLDKDGGPEHCEIYLDGNYGGFAKTVLHELGHCLGLGHSLIPEAVMSYRDEKNGFWLDTDDHAAMSRLYAKDSSAKALPPGCAIGAGVVSRSEWLVMFFLLFLPVIFLLGEQTKCRATLGSWLQSYYQRRVPFTANPRRKSMSSLSERD